MSAALQEFDLSDFDVEAALDGVGQCEGVPRKLVANPNPIAGRCAHDNLNVAASSGDANPVSAPIPRKRGVVGLALSVTHARCADDAAIRSDAGGIDRGEHAIPGQAVDPEIIATMQSLHREHRGLQAAVGDMDRRIKADERWAAARRFTEAGGVIGTKFPPVTKADKDWVQATRVRFYQSRNITEKLRKEVQAEMLSLVKDLPGFEMTQTVRGFAAPSLAAIIGEAGDLSNYANPAKLWKRMGLAVINGKAQCKVKIAAEAALQGYNPRRRSEMYVIGDSLVKTGGPYAELYRERKEYDRAKLLANGITVVPGAEFTKKKAEDKPKFMPAMHLHRRAQRYIEKRLLRELWKAWRQAKTGMEPMAGFPAAKIHEIA